MNALDLLYLPVAALTAPLWAGKKRSGWGERFGRCEIPPKPAGKKRVLLHAVSVGEVNALRTLVPMLRETYDVVVSTTTDTGMARAKSLFHDGGGVARYPLDFSWSVERFLDAVKPDVVGLIELEVWPNFVRECVKRSIPLGVLNGRLSERSFAGYLKVQRFLSPVFGSLGFLGVQNAEYAMRFKRMGVHPERCEVTGSMKWDAATIADEVGGSRELADALGIDPSKPVVVAGSTGPLPSKGAPIGYDGRGGPSWCEERLIAESCPEGVQLVCAPRKPERFDEAAKAMPGCVRRSKPGEGSAGSGRFLLDSIGELRQAYAFADVVVVGRSFGGLYGSDPIEPIALGKATIIGPSVSDFADIVAAFEAGGGILRANGANLRQCLTDVLTDQGRRRALGQAGRTVICEHQGASRRNAAMIRVALDNFKSG